MTTYRVVQWATGNIGTRSLREVIAHPHLDLVGVYVYSGEKVGRDAGELCGLSATGVVATGDIDDVLALQPDCVLYMPQRCNFDEVCRLLESGANIVTTRGEFHHPATLDVSLRARVESRMHPRRHFDSQHRQQPGLHHGSGSARPDVDPTPARSVGDRRVRRPLAAELAGTAVPAHGFRC